jgi:hypothetical protein
MAVQSQWKTLNQTGMVSTRAMINGSESLAIATIALFRCKSSNIFLFKIYNKSSVAIQNCQFTHICMFPVLHRILSSIGLKGALSGGDIQSLSELQTP